MPRFVRGAVFHRNSRALTLPGLYPVERVIDSRVGTKERTGRTNAGVRCR
jgi:hypothetical protein